MKFRLNIAEIFARQPFFWDLFEFIFGANQEKRRIYRGVISDNGKMLDFGCSTGNTTGSFLDFEYYGVDINRKYINWAKSKWIKQKNAHFICANILKKPFPRSFFDFILFAGTGHHLNKKELISLLSEFCRLLRPGGILYFFDILKPKNNDNFLIKWLVSIDRGKYIRSEEEWQKIFRKEISFSILERKVFFLTNTFIPQPNFIYFKLKKLNTKN